MAQCTDCGSERYSVIKNKKPMPYRCKDCRHHFSVRKGTVMQASPLSYQKWAIAIYMVATSLKGVSSMKSHRDLKIRQSSAWHLAQRIRKGFVEGAKLEGIVEIDETFVRTLSSFVSKSVQPNTTIYTDDHKSYTSLKGEYDHATVKHSVGEYVRHQAHTNGIESFRALLKREYHGTYHHMNEKHLARYVVEFSGRFNIRELNTPDQMSAIVRSMAGKRLRYQDLVT